MSFRPNVAARNAVLDEGLDHFDGATATIYNGTQPDAGGGAHSDSDLAEGTLPTPAFAAASGGARAPTTWILDIGSTGLAGWMRIAQTGGAVLDFEVGDDGDDVELDDVELVEGGIVRIQSGAITLPGNDAS